MSSVSGSGEDIFQMQSAKTLCGNCKSLKSESDLLQDCYSRLGAIQSRILVTIFQSDAEFVKNEVILKGAGISRSTWGVEQNNLIAMGLIEKKFTRSISAKCVLRTARYKLTARGRAVSFNLLEISKILDSGKYRSSDLKCDNDSVLSDVSDSDILLQMRECIEVALEGYGINFVGDVRRVLEGEFHVRWDRIPRRTDLLILILGDFFGLDGSKTIESMICKNIRSRFALEKSSDPDDLQSLMAELIFTTAGSVEGEKTQQVAGSAMRISDD